MYISSLYTSQHKSPRTDFQLSPQKDIKYLHTHAILAYLNQAIKNKNTLVKVKGNIFPLV